MNHISFRHFNSLINVTDEKGVMHNVIKDSVFEIKDTEKIQLSFRMKSENDMEEIP